MCEWTAKGLFAAMLAIACATPAFGQTKSAQLPVQERIDCVPPAIHLSGPIQNPLPELTQPITDALCALQHELSAANLSTLLSGFMGPNAGQSWGPVAELIPAWLPAEPLGTMWVLLSWH